MSPSYFPFDPLGLRCNPFRTLTDEEQAAAAVLPPGLEALLAGGPRHLQLLGEPGRGKSTTLLALGARFREQGYRVAYEYLPEGTRRFATDPSGLEVFLLDEAQRLGPLEKRRLLRSASGRALILSAHDDWSGRFRARGLELAAVTLDTLTAEQLRAILERRLLLASTTTPPPYRLGDGLIAFLHRSYGSDVRAMIRLLYEFFQGLPEPGKIGEEPVAALAAVLRESSMRAP
jgi:hypothetical protein